MSDIWVTSDLHFGHKNIINYTRNQFATVEEHNEAIVDNINSVVRPNDVLVLLGDTAFGKVNINHVSRLNGYKRLIMGNHDTYDVDTYRKLGGVDKFYGAWEKAGLIFTHIPVHPCQFDRYRGNVHGHLHDQIIRKDDIDFCGDYAGDSPDTRYFNACLEQHNMMPVHLDEIRAYFSK